MKLKFVLLLVIGMFAKIYLSDDPMCYFEKLTAFTLGGQELSVVYISVKN
jgi:hypothetical protein